MGDVIGAGLFALVAAFSAVAYQYWQFRQQLKIARNDTVSDSKKRVIETLVAYRFVLISDRRNDPEPTMRFNAALSAIPIHFSHSKLCMDKYSAIGNDFTAEKYYDLIIELMKDVPLGTASIDKNLLENVPRVTPKNN
jgi:hypothetical protein